MRPEGRDRLSVNGSLSQRTGLRMEDASLGLCIRQCFWNCPWFPAVCAGVKVFREGRPGRQRENGPQRPTLKDPVNEDQVAMTSQIQSLDRELKLTGRDEMDGR